MKKLNRGILIAAALVSGTLTNTLRAQILTLGPNKDNTLYQDPFGAISNGAGEHFFVGLTFQPGIRRGLMAFDLFNAMPQGTVIDSASLGLVMTRNQGNTEVIELHRASTNWGEGISNAGENGGGGTTAATGDATWLNSFYNSVFWNTPGGDFSTTVSGSTTITFAGNYSVPSTTQMVSDLQGWLNAPSSNFGWVITGNETSPGTAARFETREAAIVANRPKLALSLTLPTNTAIRNVDADGNWDTPGEWLGGVPNAAGAHAFFGNSISAPRVVSFISPHTLGQITLNSLISYTLFGIAPLTIDGSAGTIQANSGSHSIFAPIHLATNTTIDVAAPATLTLGAAMTSIASATLTKTGSGDLRVAQIRATALSIQTGKINVIPNGNPSGISRVGALTIAGTTDAWTARFDLADNDLIVDYNGTSPLSQIRNQIKTARNGGAWTGNGITSSLANATTHTLGYGEASAVGISSFNGESVDATTVLVKYTWYGDATLDGIVDIRDLQKLALAFGSSNDAWTSGDFNFDGLVNIADLTILAQHWQAGVGSPAVPGSLEAALSGLGFPAVPVPEPVTLLWIASITPCLLRRR